MGTMREVWRWFSSSSSFRSIMLITMWEVWRWFSSSFSLGSIMLGTMWEVWRWFVSTWTWFSSSFSFIFGGIMLTYAMYKQCFPTELREYIRIHWNRFLLRFKHNIKISVHQYSPGPGEYWKLSEAYTAIETYLGTKSATQAKRLKAKLGNNSKDLVFSMGDYEEITDVHQGVVLTWSAIKSSPNRQHSDSDDEWCFEVEFHRKHRNFVMETYMSYAIEQGKAIALRSRKMKLYGNTPTTSGQKWGYVVFDHPARFENLAMDPVKKQEIMDDLVTFSKAKEYYAKVGKIWKRGYLLYGPPGTGKTTMVAAIANFLNYDIYDLELTAVKKNSELRQLLIGTNNKSIIVIEDIDCSLDLTGQRKNVKNDDDDDDGKKKNPNLKKDKKEDDSSKKESEVTLSGLLNFIDGLWSACGTERIIIFTTNYIEKLDPALIRKGRMDKHIELAYCEFEGFKVLAKNYLDIDSHPLFDTIRELMEETSMTPADVAENLIPKTVGIDASTCLESLIQALQNAKEESKLKKKAEEEATHLKKKKKEAEEEENLKKAKEEATNLKKKKKKKAEEEAADLKKKKNKKKPEEKTRLKKEASKVEEGDDKPNKDEEEEQNELLVKQQQQHIELSYCGFEGFKVLAKNHLQIVSHDLFETIRGLIEETQMSPADVAEHLIPKTVGMDSEHCLKSLIQALEMSKKKQC